MVSKLPYIKLAAAPGVVWQYSNFGYSLAARAIEGVIKSVSKGRDDSVISLIAIQPPSTNLPLPGNGVICCEPIVVDGRDYS